MTSISRKYNPYPDNPKCKRPKDSKMRLWCRCMECITYERDKRGLSHAPELLTMNVPLLKIEPSINSGENNKSTKCSSPKCLIYTKQGCTDRPQFDPERYGFEITQTESSKKDND